MRWPASLAGCGLTSGSAAAAPAAIATEPTPTLADRFAPATDDISRAALLQEMLRRHAISDEHIAAIRYPQGRREHEWRCETIAAWGPPDKYSTTPGIDYHADASMVSASMVYDYGYRAAGSASTPTATPLTP